MFKSGRVYPRAMHACMCAQFCPALLTPWTIALQAPLVMGFSRPESWSGMLFPSPGDLLNPGIKPESPALADRFFTTMLPGKPNCIRKNLRQAFRQRWNVAPN